jgi:hypothetical protein
MTTANTTITFHPLAELFPLMQDAEFDALVADIKANGPLEHIVLYEGKILDGRNRYRALRAAGLDPATIRDKFTVDGMVGDDPAAYVISANIHRRHLTAEQKRDLIAKLLAADPSKSDRQIAKTVKASPTFVGKVRAEGEATGDVSTVDTRKDTKGRKQPARKTTKAPRTTPKPEVNPLIRAWDRAEPEMQYELIRSRGEGIVRAAFDVEAGSDKTVSTAVKRAIGAVISRPESATPEVTAPSTPRTSRPLTTSVVKAIADRAEAASNRKRSAP